MATPLSITTDRRDDGTFVLTAAGEVDLSNIDSFAGALDEGWAYVDADGARLTVDLTDIAYLDSCAINALFNHTGGIRLIVNPILIPVLTISGLTEMAVVEPAG
ncbi:STAS domain-containing protein [Mycobacterium sp. 1274761.0]|uniref:STAS domain-containing protein n=1 Tax=Mycobacterium sp. 1274761.0 TaxID=1834077 RepID=UPI000801129C|nr:STAS domain-containing protein [Mycobacterium sp. 1274761.0]OBK71213.1 anti-anti-sigma factor [Mycobacterium sp. 1274761.0]